ncbi:MAG: hypothetical protein PHF56_15755 [Desulfuromonadaceae bacterium]|nr:hypothetical protein [Desulfuromonadaceae bacterium]
MEITREIYWNIGNKVVLPMYLLSIASLMLLVWGIWKRVPLYRLGKPLNRFDRYDERVKRMICEVFSQQKAEQKVNCRSETWLKLSLSG